MSISATEHDPYLSPNPMVVTHHLTNLYIAGVAQSNPETAKLLTEFRDTAWPSGAKPAKKVEQQALVERMIRAGGEQDYEAQKALFAGMMRLGQLYDVAALVARGNAFDENRRVQGEDRVSDSTGGVENLFEILIKKDKSKKNGDLQYEIPFDGFGHQPGTILKDALGALSKPVFEVVMTTHPTNVNALASLRELRNLAKSIHDYRKTDDEDRRVAIKGSIENNISALCKADPIPVIEKQGKKVPGNISVRGEVDMVLFYLENMYEDLPQVYRGFEEPIKRLTRKSIISENEKYNPLDLKLNIRASAWGLSGDKDGNKNVNANTTLEALLATKVKLLDLYLSEMDGLPEDVKPDLQEKMNVFAERKRAYETALEQVTAYTSKGEFIPAAKFDAIVADLPKVAMDEPKKFAGELESLYEKHPSSRLLAFTRRVRSFGYHFAKIEYRETAEEYARVVSEILPGYKDLHEESISKKDELSNLENAAKIATQKRELLQEFMAVKEAYAQLESFAQPQHTLQELAEQAQRLAERIDLTQGDKADEHNAAQTPKTILGARLQQIEKKLSEMTSPDDAAVNERRQKLRSDLGTLEAKKRTLLTDALKKGAAGSMLAKRMAEIATADTLPYDKETDVPRNALPISYQTIKRMELAREFPEMITANVLAECQNTSNILEAVFLQAACATKDKRPCMGVVPLFEEPDTMQRVAEILEGAYLNPQYKHHMEAVSRHLNEMGWTDGKLRQQVQIAHSDNARRSGFLAARAFIDGAHINIRDLNEKNGITTEFFEGGSLSDAYRGGVRSISAAVNSYGLHDFMKFTFQGGDLPNYFGSPGSTVRLFTRNIAHAAKKFLGGEKEPTETGANLNEYNEIAQQALQGTLGDYQRNIFNKEVMGNFMKFAADPYGNVGSRAGARGGAAETDPDKVRTIGFSEMFQHAGVLPTFLGAATVAENLREAILAKQPKSPGFNSEYKLVALHKNEGEVEDVIPIPTKADIKQMDPQIFGVFYDKSAVFRNSIDGLAFGLAVSNIDILKQNYPMLKDDPFVARIEKDYRAAAHIALGALPEVGAKAGVTHEQRLKKSKHSKTWALDPNVPLAEIREAVRERLPHLKASIQHKSALFDTVTAMKASWRQDWKWEQEEEKNAAFAPPAEDVLQHGWMMRLAHGAIDSVTHGRYLMADDPMYMRMLHPEYHDARKERRTMKAHSSAAGWRAPNGQFASVA